MYQSIDVGHALELMLYDDSTASQTFELYGPKEYSMEEIAEMVDKEIFTKRRHINVPQRILEPAARLINRLLWWPVLSAEQVQMEHIDQVIDEKARTFKDLGIEPGEISKFTYQYVVCFYPFPKAPAPVTLIRSAARIPQWYVLRSTASERERKERREEIPARPG